MVFAATKIILYLILPPSSLILLMIAGFLIMRKYKVTGRVCVATGLCLLYMLCLAPVADWLIGPLERFHPPFKGPDARTAQAIVVLGGGVHDLAWAGLDPQPSSGSLERLISGIKLHRVTRLPLVMSGGSGLPVHNTLSEADAMARTAADLGVLRKDMVIENRSRNTLENAAAVGQVLVARKIYLVTSAFHMKRSAALFRKKGFKVIPVPSGYAGGYKPLSYLGFIPHSHNLQVSAMALSEYLSYSWYWLHGDL